VNIFPRSDIQQILWHMLPNFFLIIYYIKLGSYFIFFIVYKNWVKLHMLFLLLSSVNCRFWVSFHVIRSYTAIFLIPTCLFNANEHMWFFQCFAFTDFVIMIICVHLLYSVSQDRSLEVGFLGHRFSSLYHQHWCMRRVFAAIRENVDGAMCANLEGCLSEYVNLKNKSNSIIICILWSRSNVYLKLYICI